MWKTIPVHAENTAKSSPSSLLHLIYDVVDVGAFWDFSLCYLLLPTFSQDSLEAPIELALYLLVCHVSEAYNSTEWTMDLYIFSFVLVWRVVDFQMLVLKACAAMTILVENFFQSCCLP